jgi:hypothetical protein
MQQSETTMKISCPATTAATANTIEGGLAYVAEITRRLAPYCARSGSRQRAPTRLQDLLREAERKHSWQIGGSLRRANPVRLPVLAEPRGLNQSTED